MEFTIRFADDGRYVWVTADKTMVFDAGEVEKVELTKTAASFRMTVVNKAGDRKVYSPRGVEVVRASESRLERVGRLLERLERDHPAPQKAEAADEVSAGVAQDIGDFFESMRGKDTNDEQE